MTTEAVALALMRLVLAAVFAWASVAKINALASFRSNVTASKLFRAPAVALIVVGVPICELILATWLVLMFESAAPLVASVTLLIVFTLYVALLRGLKRDVACGCFRRTGRISDPMIARNVGLICIALAGLNGAIVYPMGASGLALFGYWALAVSRRAKRVPDASTA